MVARRDFAGGAAATTLAADINATATTITLASGTGWPTGANGEFYICIDRGQAGEEKCLVLSRSGTALTLASAAKRGKDGTTAASHTAGVSVEHVGTAADLDEANAFIATPGVAGEMSASAPGDTAAAGSVGKWADIGHRHAREAASAAAPRGVLYRSANVTATQTVGIGYSDVTGLTAITVTGDGVRRVRISARLVGIQPSASGYMTMNVREGGSLVQQLDDSYIISTGFGSLIGAYDFVPAAGSHTYKLEVYNGTAGNADLNVAGNGSVIVEDIGT